jgi:hypothetical protein
MSPAAVLTDTDTYSALITRSGYICFSGLKTKIVWCLFGSVGVCAKFFYELLLRKGGYRLMIAGNISLLSQVALTASLPGGTNPSPGHLRRHIWR